MEMATKTSVRSFADDRQVETGERSRFLRIDPYAAFAAIALVVTSVLVLAFTTKGDVPGNPYFYVIRQSIYGVVGLALMLALTRIDYSRFRELRVGIYSAMIFSISIVLLLGSVTLAYHSMLGLQVVIEDYVHGPALKVFSLILSKFVHVFLGLAAVLAVLNVALGGSL